MDDEECVEEIDSTVSAMNMFLKLAAGLIPSPTNWVLVGLFAVTLLWTVVIICQSFLEAQRALAMTSGEERRYIQREFPPSEDLVLKESAWVGDVSGKRLREDYEQHTKMFIPILGDIRRALKEFTSGEGGNMATVAELKELQRHPEVHVVIDTGSGDMIRSVLTSGNTAINHLVWRKSQIVICQFVLFVLGVFELYQLSKLQGDDHTTDLVATSATYAAGACQLLCTSDSVAAQTGACASRCSSMVFGNESSNNIGGSDPCGRAEDPETVLKVRKTPSWPRTSANFSPL
jgi:hypothetical protein